MKPDFYRVYGKRLFDLVFVSLILILIWPLFLLIGFAILADSKRPVIFKQKRTGKDGKVFLMHKFRTMKKNAEELKSNYLKFNEADGPVFKIRDDPRFTKVGKLLAKTGLDELPQFINVLKGEMSIVGPRPLPVNEAKRISTTMRNIRESVLPGITSEWVISGSHKLSFPDWMQLDKDYALKMSLSYDVSVLWKTVIMMLFLVFRLIVYGFKKV